MERVKGIEPSFSAWEADVLPLNYTRIVGPFECSLNQLSNWNRDCSARQFQAMILRPGLATP